MNNLRNQPFHDILFDRLFKAVMVNKGHIEFRDCAHAFKRVAVVGMLFPTKPKFSKFPMPDELREDDKSMVHTTLSSFSEAGIPTSPNVEFDIYNLLPPISSDFLRAANFLEPIAFPNVDLVIVNYLPKYGFTKEHWHDYNVSEGFSNLSSSSLCSINANGKLVSVSEMHQQKDVWAEASFNVGASFIAAHGGIHDEVTTEELKEHEKSCVILDSAVIQAENRKQKKYGRVMGVVANTDTLPSYMPHVNKNSAIGAAILNI